MSLPPPSPPSLRAGSRLVAPAAVLVVLAVSFLLVECAARLALAARDPITALPAVRDMMNRSLVLDSYKMPSPEHGGHWTLRPGFGADVAQVVAEKQAMGKVDGAAAWAEAIRQAGRKGVLVINDDGFKGPPLRAGHPLPRVLVVGDSVTFGYAVVDPVRAMEESAAAAGTPVEAVNGGVEGYATRNALLEVGHYRRADADMVVILLGWNDLLSMQGDEGSWTGHVASLRLLRHGIEALARWGHDPLETANRLRRRPKVPDPDAPQLARLRGVRPALVDRVQDLGHALSADGACVVVATLPGLFVSDSPPSAKALSMGHLPEFTDNPYALAALTDAANDHLRRLSAEQGWGLVDLDRWSRLALDPRDAHFVDSVHMTNDAITKTGSYLADRLSSQAAACRDRRKPSGT